MEAQQKSIRVAVRVRPLLPTDGPTGTTLLHLDPGRPCEVVLARPGADGHTARRYKFDQVFGPDVTQGQLYDRAGVSTMVAAAVAGYHATVFAYGQTGSGKTYTMEGYRYVTRGSAHTGTSSGSAPLPTSSSSPAPSAPSAATAGGAAATAAAPVAAVAVGSTQRGAAAGSAAAAAAAVPHADPASTPEGQLGIVPRAVKELFQLVARDTGRRYTVKVSFVQIYREQVYDLLNPASLEAAPGQLAARGGAGGRGGRRGSARGAGGVLCGPLRLRWSPQEEFYLENLFTPEVESEEEALGAFQAGVANKVMASHRLNASSSRSHCLFTLHVTSAPAACALEARSARLTLVDLAGSERAATTGATEGALRDESVAINKSLFTLRQVITALTEASASASASAAAAAPAPPHVPYRDSKLTCLLKHSLGGSSLTLMLACLSPADRFLEENASTLDYAARARRITNQVAVNEDPRSRLIRELRAEVAFLRQQLEAAAGSAAPALPHLAHLPPHATSATPTAKPPARPGKTAPAATTPPTPPITFFPAAHGGGGGGDGEGGGNDEAAYAARLAGAEVEVLVRSVIEASRVAVASSAALAELRAAYARSASALEALRAEHASLQAEDARLRDRLDLLEALVAADAHSSPASPFLPPRSGTAASGGGQRPAGRSSASSLAASEQDGAGEGGAPGANGGPESRWYTASTAALIELEELRRENALLHERLQLFEPEWDSRASTPAAAWAGFARASGPGPTAGPAAARQAGRRPGTGASIGAGFAAGGSGAGLGPALRQSRSAGALRATGGRAAAVAAAAAASNPFTPREVLLAVMPPGPSPGGSRPATGASVSTGGGGGGTRPPTGIGRAGAGGGKALTVEQLRSMLQMGGGGGGGGGGAEAASAASSRPSTSASALFSPGAGGAAAAGSGGGGGDAGRLAELGHAVASRALGSGVRLSTTGKLLPAAPARVAVEAAVGDFSPGGGGGGGSGSGIGGGGGGVGTGGLAPRPTSRGTTAAAATGGDGGGVDGSGGSGNGGAAAAAVTSTGGRGVAEGDAAAGAPVETALASLLAERNALTRQHLAGGL